MVGGLILEGAHLVRIVREQCDLSGVGARFQVSHGACAQQNEDGQSEKERSTPKGS